MSADGETAAPQTVEQRLNQLEDRVTELEAENEQLRDELEREREIRCALIHAKADDPTEADAGEVFIGNKPVPSMVQTLGSRIDSLDGDLEDEVSYLEDQIKDEEKNRGQEDAKLRRRVEALADALDVEIVDSDIYGEDKIRRVLKHGASDLDSNPGPTAIRAQCLLRHIGKWGNKQNDGLGKRILISSPTVADRLEDVRDERLSTEQIKRVFRKIEEWGADSPREVRFKPGSRGGDPHKLRMELNTE